MPTVNATAKSASANSYVTLAEADTYHDERLHNAEWSAASSADKERAVIWATGVLEANFNWYGIKRTREQSLQWPRYGVTDESGYTIDEDTIPVRLKDATSVLAYLLIVSDRTKLDGDSESAGLKSLGIGSGEVEIEFNANDRKVEIPTFIANMLTELGAQKSTSVKTGSNRSSVARVVRG